MPQCTGCSRIYRFLEGDHCTPCTELTIPSKPQNEWPSCTHCSKRYEFLDPEKPCFQCQARNDSQAMPPPPPPSSQVPSSHTVSKESNRDIHHAMSNGVNPRTHSASGAPAWQNPLQSYGHTSGLDENDVSPVAVNLSSSSLLTLHNWIITSLASKRHRKYMVTTLVDTQMLSNERMKAHELQNQDSRELKKLSKRLNQLGKSILQ